MKVSPVFLLFFGFFSSTSVVVDSFNPLGRLPRNVVDVFSSWLFRDACMGELGCFNNGPPFFNIRERPASFLPSAREVINTHFHLFTRMNIHRPQNFSNMDRSQQDILQSWFTPGSPIKFIVPGFISSWAPDWINPLKDDLLKEANVNVFIVDWKGGDGPLYEQAVSNTRVVGAEMAVFIEYLQNTTGARAGDVHIIGHSLGSHIAGYAGKRVKNIGRITGLDPAGPYFENVSPDVRLAHTDAIFVDVIHTNGANSRFVGFGTTESIGDLDFFPNGGRFQPGCPKLGSAIWSFLQHPSLSGESMHEIMCNHHRAIELFASSITEKHCDMVGVLCNTWEDFLEKKCKSCYDSPSGCVIMGHEADMSWRLTGHRRGNIYLNTTDSPPYCLEMK